MARPRSHECVRCAFRAPGEAPARCPSCGRLGTFVASAHEAPTRIPPENTWGSSDPSGIMLPGQEQRPDYGFGAGSGNGGFAPPEELARPAKRGPEVQLQNRDLDDVEPTVAIHLESGCPIIDTITCGGPCVGSVSGLTSFPGVGKSTLLLEMAYRYRASGRRVTIVALEESSGDIARRARRLNLLERFPAGARRGGKSNGWVKILSPLDGPEGESLASREARMAKGFNLTLLLEQIDGKTEVCIVDSVSRCHNQEIGDKLATPRQLKDAGHVFYERCHGIGRFGGKKPLVGFGVLQSTKEGDSAVPQAFTHTVDATYMGEHVMRDGLTVVACPDQKRPTGFVCFRSHGKNRDGSTTASVYARMTATGLVQCEEEEVIAGAPQIADMDRAIEKVRSRISEKRKGEYRLEG